MISPIPGRRIPTEGKGSFGFDRGGGHTHQGVDIGAPKGEPIYSPTFGVVTHATNKLALHFSGYGRNVVIKHGLGDGPWLMFAHLQKVGPGIFPGAVVEQGQLIGYVGDSCFSKEDPAKVCSGPHLHFEVSPRKYYQDSEAPRQDPVAWLQSVRVLDTLSQAGSPGRRELLKERGAPPTKPPKEPWRQIWPPPGQLAAARRGGGVAVIVLTGVSLLGVMTLLATRKRGRV